MHQGRNCMRMELRSRASGDREWMSRSYVLTGHCRQVRRNGPMFGQAIMTLTE
jgi:hypothetical protein